MIEVNTPQEALQVLINVAKVAVKRGAFELEETEIILKAIKSFTTNVVNEVENKVKEVVKEVEDIV